MSYIQTQLSETCVAREDDGALLAAIASVRCLGTQTRSKVIGVRNRAGQVYRRITCGNLCDFLSVARTLDALGLVEEDHVHDAFDCRLNSIFH